MGTRPDELDAIPLLAGLNPATKRRLRRQLDVADVAAGTTLVRRGRVVQWVGFEADGVHAGRVVGLAEALAHRPADRTVRTDGPATVLFIDVRRLSALIATDGSIAAVVTRHLANEQLDATAHANRRPTGRFERRPRSVLAAT